jgi:hypothetical protein
MHAAGAHLAVEHRVLRGSDFLLRHDLAFTVGHRLDHGFGFGEVLAATAGADSRGISGNDRINNRSHCGCCDQFVEHGAFPSSVFLNRGRRHCRNL